MSGRRLTARGRVMLAMTLVLAVSLALLVTGAWTATLRFVETSIDATLAEEAEAYSAALAGAPQDESIVSATRAYLGARTSSGAGIDPVLLVVLSDGRTLSNSDIALERAPANSSIARPPTEPTTQEFSYEGVSYRALTVPVLSGGEQVAVFQAAVSLTAARQVTRSVAVSLTVIRGNAELAASDATDAAGAAEALDAILAESLRMGRMLDELLLLSRLEHRPSREFQPLHPPTMVAEAAARARMLGDRRIETFCTDDVWTLGDPDQLEQALMNVVRNAVKATSEGGLVRIGCTVLPDRVRLTVEDDGPGFDAGDLHRVFDRFFRSSTVRADAQGSGLGLAIAKRIVELHGGHIEASNRPEGGAVVTIELPRIPAPAGADTDTSASTGAGA